MTNSLRILFISLLMQINSLYAFDIPIEKVQKRTFGEKVTVNAKIVQLSNAQQLVTSLLSGHVERYFVQSGESVSNGDKIALINSIELSKMTADYISLNNQYRGLRKNYDAVKNLYDKGMTSLHNLNIKNIEKNEMYAKIQTLDSQLGTLGINADNLKKVTSRYTLFAHSDGKVASILQPLHSIVDNETPLVSIVKNRAFYAKSYLPIQYASFVKIGQKVVIERKHNKHITSKIAQILPELDETTQRLVVLSSIENENANLFINEYVGSTIYFDNSKEYLSVKKTALSFFNNEWVVFVPIEEHEEKGEHGHSNEHLDHDNHDMHEDEEEHSDEELKHDYHDEYSESNKHDEHGHNDENLVHDEHDVHEDEEESEYEAKVVKKITEDDTYVAVVGLNEQEEYVSNNSYYVKSMLLKSSLGEHGH